MGFLIWLIVGGVVGWLASLVLSEKVDVKDIYFNVVVGVVGAFAAGWLVSPLVGVGTNNDGITIGSVLISLVGAVILLTIIHLFRRGRVR